MEMKQWKPDVKIVLGALFGDEAKGNTVQWLCKQAITKGKKPLVIRFSGGAQAGHRIVHNDVSHICSSYGSGILLGVSTYWEEENTFIDPCAIALEREQLIKETGKYPGYPYLGSYFDYRYVSPLDIMSNKSNKKTLSDGSCGMGIYACFKRYNYGWGNNPDLYYKDLINEGNTYLLQQYKKDFDALLDWNLSNPFEYTHYDTLIFEGSQGLLLDMHNGFMPNCTPSKTGLNGIPRWIFKYNPEVYLVTRTYLTRHGNGYNPYKDEEFSYYIEPAEEVSNSDTGTQGKFKIGYLDLKLLNRAFDRHRLNNYSCKFHLVLTHVDCLKTKYLPIMDKYDIITPSELHKYIDTLKIEDTILFNKEEM